MPNYIDKEPYTVVALAGKANSGKDYLADEVLIQEFGFLPLSLAMWFKSEGVEFEDLPFEETFGEQPKSDETRDFYQKRGTEQGRQKHGKDVWINMVEMKMYYFKQHGFNKFVITDARYPNEFDWVHNFCGKVYRIHGRGGAENKQAKNHDSETKMDNYSNYDGYIDNSKNVQERSPKVLKTMVKADLNLGTHERFLN
jgi:hypothetical protein